MAKNVIQSTILSINGGVSVAPGASIEIRNAVSGLLVPLWLDRDGTQPTSNPFTADSNGFFRVYLDAGRYHITASKDGQSQEWRDVLLGSAAGYDVGTEPDQVPTNALLGSAAGYDVGTEPDQVPTNALLGSAAGYDVTTSPTDTTLGRVLTVGSLGLGKPTADPATPITGSLLSGAMLAAGAIVEQGTNANGSYWRWESGLQVCVCRRNFTLSINLAADIVGTGWYRTASQLVTWPAAFAAAPTASYVGEFDVDGPFNVGGVLYQVGSTAGRFILYAPASVSSIDLLANMIAIGRWK